MVAATVRTKNKKRKMVAANVRTTVVDGEVIPVIENTPPHPPPPPEPPPSFIDNNNDSTLHCDDRYGYSTTTIDWEFISIWILLFRSTYRVNRKDRVIEIFDDNNDDTIAMIMQLVVLFQGSVQIVLNQDVYDNDNDNNVQPVVLNQATYNTIVISRIVILYQDVREHDDIIYQIKYNALRPFHLVYHGNDDANSDNTIPVISSLDRIGETELVDDVPNDVVSCQEKYETTRPFQLNNDNTIAIMQQGSIQAVLNQDVHENDNDDNVQYTFHIKVRADNGGNEALNMNVLVVLYVKYNRDAVHKEDDTIAVMQLAQNNYSDRMKPWFYSDTSIDGDSISTLRFLFRLVYRHWFHSDTSIDGDFISILIFLFRLVYHWFQVKYKIKLSVHEDDDTIADVHEKDDTITEDRTVTMYVVHTDKDDTTTENQIDSNPVTIKDTDSLNRTDGEIILMIQVLLLRSMYQNQVINVVHHDVNTIQLVIRLIVLFQVKYKMIRFQYYLIYDNDVDTTSIATIQLVVVLYQVKYEMISPFHLIYNNNDDDNTKFSTSINGEKYTGQSKYKDDYIKGQVITMEDSSSTDNTTEYLTDISSLDTNKILNGEYHFALSKEITNTTEDLLSRLDRNKILNGEYHFALSKDALTNTTEDLIESLRKTVTEDDSINRTENLIDSCNMDTIKDTDTMQLVVYQAEYGESIQHGGHDDDNDTTIIIMQTMQLVALYRDKNVWYDTTMVEHTNDTAILYCYRDKNVWYDTAMVEHTSDMVLSQANVAMNQYDDKDYTIAIMKLVLYQDAHIKKDNTAIMQLARNNYYHKMKLTPTTEDSSSTDNKIEDPTNKVKIKDSNYSNIINFNIGYSNGTSMIKENGEQTTCYSNQDPYMIQFCHNVIAIDSNYNIDMIATDASLRLGHSKEKIDINETTTLIRMFTCIEYNTTRTSIEDETTTLIRTIQNGEKNNQLDYNLVIVLIYDHVISMIPVQLCLWILLIVTLRLLSQSMGSVKIHKAQVKRASQLNQVSQMRARLESGIVNQSSQIMSHESFGSFSYGRNRIPL
ncbi:hypothetical protein FRACYDRAFT_240683 [Fragilariopsis cylindrus CCMP1102]|uniref:Uncharacterized protein n=1 Tax=Fragilariopsis cylindrus CCMP1102 TaxID=635003 RepID=A0A1E7FCX2_9STRA|nr:hypothetical protein FRACYDRAFT_240683 [Fragilariopsis cylindrus CCMP1102]|eukprot:OEU15984.1 hypothetical protein FRACYDRAFT_240683 [Fragilariopsis cylindrus CCMP1102]